MTQKEHIGKYQQIREREIQIKQLDGDVQIHHTSSLFIVVCEA